MAVVKYIGWCFLIFLGIFGFGFISGNSEFIMNFSRGTIPIPDYIATEQIMMIQARAAQIVVLPIMFFGWISYRWGESLSKLVVVLGIPLGLIGLTIWIHELAIRVLSDRYHSTSLEAANTDVLMAITFVLWGGSFSIVAYFLHDRKKTLEVKRVPLSELIVLTIGVVLVWGLNIFASIGLNNLPSPVTGIILGSFYSLAVYATIKNNKGLCESLADSSVYAAVFGVVLVLGLGLSNDGTTPNIVPIRIACEILTYSLMVYVLTYMFSYYTNETKTINFSIKNWHLVETCTFFIFLVFAPISISDYLYNEKENNEQRAIETELRKEIKHLSERLAAIEKVS